MARKKRNKAEAEAHTEVDCAERAPAPCDDAAERADDGPNPELEKVIADLRTVQAEIQTRRLAATNDDDRLRLRREYDAVNRRILFLQAALFRQGVRDIAEDVKAIGTASEEVKEAIKSIEDLNAALGGIANLLGIVDQLLAAFP